MSPYEVDAMLKSYKLSVGRKKYLAVEVDRLRRLSAHSRDAEISGEALHAQNLDGMPHGTDVGRPVERLGIGLASGDKELYDEYASQLAAAKMEYDVCKNTTECVEAWLDGLTERERWIIWHQVIGGLYWRDVVCRYKQHFGEDYSKDGLKSLKERALNKIYDMAK